MYPHGPLQNDSEFRLEDSPYFSSDHCLKIDTDWTGFPFFSERHYKLYVSMECLKMKSRQPYWHPPVGVQSRSLRCRLSSFLM